MSDTDGNAPASTIPVPAQTGMDLGKVVEQLSDFGGDPSPGLRRPQPRGQPLPKREMVIEIVEQLRTVLFPGYYGTSELTQESVAYHIGITLEHVRRRLHVQVSRALSHARQHEPPCACCAQSAEEVTERFILRLPEVRAKLHSDVWAAYEGDPAATSPDEAILCYPCVLAITSYRIAHEFYQLGVPLVPRMITEHAHSITGIDIHPGAQIGERFFIDHGTGVVIGETTIIGRNVRIYQGVTLGARSFPLDADGKPIKGIPRHPIVEDDVIIYAGATILGRVTIGQGAVVGGNVWLTRDVPTGGRIMQVKAKQGTFQNGAGI